jgi:hypothetical protein
MYLMLPGTSERLMVEEENKIYSGLAMIRLLVLKQLKTASKS